MTRIGHDNPRAALICQHASAEADLAIEAATNVKVEAATCAHAEAEGSPKASSDAVKRFCNGPNTAANIGQ